jgi:hypothetical protein
LVKDLRKGVVAVSKTLEFMVKELVTISKDFSKGILEFVVPMPPAKPVNKPELCVCRDCGRWHIKAK